MGFFFLIFLAILVLMTWLQVLRFVLYHEQPRWFMWYFRKGKGIADEAEDWVNRRGEK